MNRQGFYHSGTFTQRKREFITSADGLASDNIQCLFTDGNGVLYAGSDKGLNIIDGTKVSRIGTRVLKAGVRVIAGVNGSVMVGSGDSVYLLSASSARLVRSFGSDVIGICDCRGKLWILTEEKIIITDYDCKKDTLVRGLEGGKGICLTVNENNIYVATENFISVIHGKRMEWKNIIPAFSNMPASRVNCLCFDDSGYLWLGTDSGAAIHDNKSLWLTSDTVNTLPKNPVYAMAQDKSGGRYFASDVGVICRNKGALKYLTASRWVPADKVNAIAVSDDGSRLYAATSKGISLITTFETTFEEKAAAFEERMEKYHIRRGFTAQRGLENYNMDSGRVSISDNDGLWTACYVAAESFRYAATGEKEALEKARRGLNSMLLLTKITGIPGFTARAVRYPGDDEFGNGNKEWIPTPDGKCEWKCETSSDEMTGHFFGMSTYYDLCANEKEKKEIRKALLGIMDHIITNNYRLIDHDGLPTTWAAWDPELLNYDDKWFFERGINSLELLAFLKVASHISGDRKYDELYDRFVAVYHYPLNAMQHKVRDAHVCHIDDNLAFLASLTLLRLEDNESIRSLILCGMEDHWQYERTERQPLFCFIHAAFTGRDADLTEGIQSLREIPLDLIQYPMHNSLRRDLVYDTEQEEWNEPPQLLNALAYDERNIHRPDASSFETDSAGRNCAMDGTVFLLPYWIARYYGLLEG